MEDKPDTFYRELSKDQLRLLKKNKVVMDVGGDSRRSSVMLSNDLQIHVDSSSDVEDESADTPKDKFEEAQEEERSPTNTLKLAPGLIPKTTPKLATKSSLIGITEEGNDEAKKGDKSLSTSGASALFSGKPLPESSTNAPATHQTNAPAPITPPTTNVPNLPTSKLTGSPKIPDPKDIQVKTFYVPSQLVQPKSSLSVQLLPSLKFMIECKR